MEARRLLVPTGSSPTRSDKLRRKLSLHWALTWLAVSLPMSGVCGDDQTEAGVKMSCISGHLQVPSLELRTPF